jgi:16S rRNA (cytidine1402-2'-O)-methyltransferase
MPRRRSGAEERRSGNARPRATSLEAKAEREPTEGSAGSKPTQGVTPGLYIVATPIGHAEDISLRALALLKGVDVIACEDTRVTAKLAARHSIATQRIPYHDHNAEEMRPKLLARLRAGAAIALVSDAGTPLISDPGLKLVRAAIAEAIPVIPVPGPSAALAALTVSGLPSDRFLFLGFLPAKEQARRRAIAEIRDVTATLILFESAQRLAMLLAELEQLLGDRPATVARELTKFYEEVRRERLGVLARHYADAGPPKGEVVVVVGPPETESASAAAAETLDERLGAALAIMSVKEASIAVAAATGLPRRTVYARALMLAGRAP